MSHPYNKTESRVKKRSWCLSGWGYTSVYLSISLLFLEKVSYYFCLFLSPGHQCASPGCHPKQGVSSVHLKSVSVGKSKQCLIASFGLTWLWSNPAPFTSYTSLSPDFNVFYSIQEHKPDCEFSRSPCKALYLDKLKGLLGFVSMAGADHTLGQNKAHEKFLKPIRTLVLPR